MISKVLVANRGEIARRIFRTCQEMGIATVAVHSATDAGEPHAREADEAVPLPGETAADTYLNIEAILVAAKETGADAIHPGYGFLSENAGFARAVGDAGLVWIGPPPSAIETMGSKIESKRLMEEAGVPTIPGTELEGSSTVHSAAAALGFPVLIKASAGGGGKGMRVVEEPMDLQEALEGAQREAESAFGDGTLMLEKYLKAPRHIEIQVFGDSTGRVVSLHERECSIQRRHQKIIEEAPSIALDDATRRSMGDAAIAAAKAVGYVGAGTVEFLYEEGRFYFLEMNTRLQVEHPVTEAITGLDLVRLQIEVANGLTLPDKGPRTNGHAIEARLYAEDPLNDFLPVTGMFHRFQFQPQEGLRVDSGISDGSRVTVHYDPLLAKVIAHAPTREAAAAMLAGALRRAHIHGSTTNRALLVRVLEHPDFLAGNTDTRFLERNDLHRLSQPLLDLEGERLAAVAAAIADQAVQRKSAEVLATVPSGWRNSPSQPQHRSYEGAHAAHEVRYSLYPGSFAVEGVGQIDVLDSEPDRSVLSVGGAEMTFDVARYRDIRHVDGPDGPAVLHEIERFPTAELEEDAGSLHAPMPGKVIRVNVTVEDRVAEGDPLVVLEAMKMEHTLRAPHDGTVTGVPCSPGQQVEAGEVLVIVEGPGD